MKCERKESYILNVKLSINTTFMKAMCHAYVPLLRNYVTQTTGDRMKWERKERITSNVKLSISSTFVNAIHPAHVALLKKYVTQNTGVRIEVRPKRKKHFKCKTIHKHHIQKRHVAQNAQWDPNRHAAGDFFGRIFGSPQANFLILGVLEYLSAAGEMF